MNAPSPITSEIAASRVGLGCASLMRASSAAERDRLLNAAFQHGIRHYDVARSYGIGAAERELGRFAQHHRDDITVSTKFGLQLAGGLGKLGKLQQPARAFLNKVPAARKALKKRAGAMIAGGDYTVEHGRESLETSLRELGLDHVDYFFLHGPKPTDTLDYDALRTFFEGAVAAGKIRRWGVSYDEVPGWDPLAQLGPDAMLQVRETVLDRVVRTDPYFSFGVLGEPLELLRERFKADPALGRRWSDALGFDVTSGPGLPKLLLSNALDNNQRGTVLYGTVTVSRLPLVPEVLSDPSSPETIAALRGLVDADRAVLSAV